MNFKIWLESVEEIYSNTLTDLLCKFIKDYNRLPEKQNNEILGGYTSQAGTRLGYNTEITEYILSRHLYDLKTNFRNNTLLNSDLEILKKNKREYIFEKPATKEEISREYLEKLAEFYKSQKPNRYPSKRSRIPEERRLGNWHERKIRAKKGLGQTILYPGEEQLGIQLGLPVNWLGSRIEEIEEMNRKKSEENLRKLAEFYKSQTKYPSQESLIPEERKLANWHKGKIQAKKGLLYTILYPGEEELGIQLGLPENWLGPRIQELEEINRKKSEENLRKLAYFYEKNKKYPFGKSPIPEERRLSRWLYGKRLAKKGLGETILYPGEEELGIKLGLPANWLDSKTYANKSRITNHQEPSDNSRIEGSGPNEGFLTT